MLAVALASFVQHTSDAWQPLLHCIDVWVTAIYATNMPILTYLAHQRPTMPVFATDKVKELVEESDCFWLRKKPCLLELHFKASTILIIVPCYTEYGTISHYQYSEM